MTLFHESPASGILVLESRVALSAEEGVEKCYALFWRDAAHFLQRRMMAFVTKIYRSCLGSSL